MTQRLTREQAAIIGAYTGTLCGAFSDLHEYAEEKLDRPIFKHELAGSAAVELRIAARDDFLNICALVPVQ